MAKKRRKLSPELEKNISLAKKQIELITAIIQDIDEEDDWLKAEMKFMKFKEGSSLKVRTENEL